MISLDSLSGVHQTDVIEAFTTERQATHPWSEGSFVRGFEACFLILYFHACVRIYVTHE